MTDTSDAASPGLLAKVRPLQSFMGAPHPGNPAQAGAAVLGLPFDCGTHPTRIGARQGPAAIREQSNLVRPFLPDRPGPNPLETLNVIDIGDADVTAAEVTDAQGVIERTMTRLLEAGVTPLVLGGDGAIALPQMRALHRRYPDLVVLHIDAHTDAYPDPGYTTATSFSRAAEEGVVDPTRSVHLGIRGSTYRPDVIGATRQLGYHVITTDELFAGGIARTAAGVKEIIGSRPVYACFDMDFYDPSCAPGVCTPTWGGASAREGFQLIRALAGLDIVAVDVNTVSPPHDVGGMTALLAAATLFEFIRLLEQSKQTT